MSHPTPKISIVTPSYNQGAYLEETIRSVTEQNYPALEYVIIDGGSTDSSVDIIRRYESRLAYWVSEKDKGHYDAINKGFAKTTGNVMAWLNSDDKYTPWALSIVGEIFATFPQIEWLTTLHPLHWDKAGRAISCSSLAGFTREGFFRGEHLPAGDWHSRYWIQQESTFWRRSLWEKAGGKLDTNFSLAADFELWARFYRSAELYAVGTPLGGFRLHGEQKTARQIEEYTRQATSAFLQHGGKPPGRWQSFWNNKLEKVITRLDRKYAQRLKALPPTSLCLNRGAAGGWRFKSP